MRTLIRYLIKNHVFLLFVLLETTALVMVINYNSFQKAKYLNSANRITGNIYRMNQAVNGYFGLARINRELAEDNARLRMFITNHSGIIAETDSLVPSDQSGDSAFSFISAKVIKNSVNRPFNYITLDKGSKHGIKPDHGIISAKGIVGVVAQVSESYALGLSVLNQRWSVSAKLKKSGYYGSLVWQGNDYRFANLTEIPLHVDIARGDTVTTSGYSYIFPEGIFIGTIHDFSRPDGENYYSVEVKLAVDFKAVSHVEVIDNTDKHEINVLENLMENDKEIY